MFQIQIRVKSAKQAKWLLDTDCAVYLRGYKTQSATATTEAAAPTTAASTSAGLYLLYDHDASMVLLSDGCSGVVC